ncbi:hypothetical protein JTE90_019690 [Oedothorax gibbosus]|uniref:Cyclic nucleotide-binding domain-containing protein n=1 Tax=Oedothorax gibbosus TaxID=931172 RepID=A0AAV6UEY7_9ARAC|nr:hypothetical protein JTE90_019690 [Oedothorax gibbosus]
MESQNYANKGISKSEYTDLTLDLDDELYESIPFEYEFISPETKEFFSLPSMDRNSKNILIELDKLEFFQSFSNNNKKKLCKKMTYGSFKDKEYLLEQGKTVTNMFVLLSGVVCLRYNVFHLGLVETYWPEMVLRSGDYFGHHDLLDKRRSTVDVYAVGYSEVLMLNADDFGIVKEELEVEHMRLKQSLRSCKVFQKFGWSSEELNALEIFSKLRCYLETVEVYNGDDGARPKWSWFVVAGDCTLVRKVSYNQDSSQTRLRAVQHLNVAKENDLLQSLICQDGERHQHVSKSKHLQFCNVQRGFFFGVGEDFGRNRVLANPATECLLVFRPVLKHKNAELLREMATSLARYLPSDQVLLDNFLLHETASKEVEDVIEDILKGKSFALVRGEKKYTKPPFRKYV